MLRRHGDRCVLHCLFIGDSLPHLSQRAGVPLCADRAAGEQVEHEQIVDQPGMDTLFIQWGDYASLSALVSPYVFPSHLSPLDFFGVPYLLLSKGLALPAPSISAQQESMVHPG